METELKYTIADRALIEEIFNDDQVRRYKDENTEVLIPMNAVFYDTPDYKLQRAGFAFRIRREGDENVATLKWGGTTSEGMHKRQELNITLDDEEARHPAISIFGQDEVGGELERLIGDEPLEALMEIQSSSDNSSLTNIAWSCGYYDLAHMTSDFRDICGFSPSELIRHGEELTEAFGLKFSGLMKKKIKIENLI